MSAEKRSHVSSASFAPCPDCGEGTLAWDPVENESACVVCDGSYPPV